MSGESLRDRLSGLSRTEMAGLIAFVLIVLAGAGLWYARSLPRPVEVRAGPGLQPGPAFASPYLSPSPAVIVVHVAGWVKKPGVYEFHEGDRVIDAVRAAGGARRGANLDALNLAALLTDGTQVLVPRTAPVEGSGTAGVGATTGETPAKININIASATELEALPGVGEVIAQRIVDYRTQNGPFASVDALLDVSGIGPATLEEIRPFATV